jgi:hypothetical protein
MCLLGDSIRCTRSRRREILVTDFRIGDKVRSKSTGQVGYVDEVDIMTRTPYVRFADNPNCVVWCIAPSDYDDLEVLEANGTAFPLPEGQMKVVP